MSAPAPDRVVAPRPTTCQMFETPIMERFSRIHPATPFVFWLPVLGYAAHHGLVVLGVGAPLFAGLLLAGLLTWSFTEYTLHRWLFHYVGPRPWQRRLYFVLHGVHHDFPSDGGRLVMPLPASVPLGALFYLLFRAIAGAQLVDPLFVGFGLGYLAYDGTHYATHHWRMKSGWGKYIKKYHLVHHFTGVDARYGVSSPLWDWVFGTAGEGSPKT